MRAKFEEGSRLVQWCFSLVDLAVREWLGAWLENPASSWMFRLSECEELLRRTPSVGCRNYCRFGAAWRKQTLFLGNLPCIRYRRGLLELAGWMTSSWSTRNPWPFSTRFGMSSSLRSSTTLYNENTFRALLGNPELLVLVAKSFGSHLFSSGRPLYGFRHTLAYL